jgi:hypothetical protein
MKRNILDWAGLALLSSSILLFTSCSTEPKGESAGFAAVQQGVPGGTIVETYKVTATVTAVDAVSRKVTLTMADGAKTTFKAGPEVVNFD